MKRLSIVGGFVGVFLLIPALLCAQRQDDPLWTKRLAEARALAKKEGFPLSLAEIPKRNVPDADNAATYASQLDDLRNKKPLADSEKDYLQAQFGIDINKVSPQQWEQARRAFANRKDIAELVEKMVGCKNYYFPITLKLTRLSGSALVFQTPVPALNAMSAMSFVQRYLRAKNWLLLHEGRTQEAIGTARSGFRLARATAQGYDSYEIIHAWFLESDALLWLATTLQFSGEKRGVAQEVANTIKSENVSISYARTLGFDLARELDMMEMGRRNKEAMKQLCTFLRSDTLDYKAYRYPHDPVQSAIRLINANETNFTLKTALIKRVLSAPYCQKLPEGFPPDLISRGVYSKNPDACFAEDSLSVWHGLRRDIARLAATRVVTLIGAQVLAWKVSHGAFPASLREVLPNVPLDPFDGKPLRYRKEGAGFVVYSVGETGKYDGRVFDRRRGRESVFRYPAPSQKAR